MSFRDNLQHLRATRNMTQEQLAMLLGVSRQSVSKWEAERAYPEMDKLLKLCDLFGCTLDELVLGDLTDRPTDAVSRMPVHAVSQDVTGYDQAMRSFAWKFPLGVVAIIVGFSLAVLLSGPEFSSGDPSQSYATVLMLAGIAVGFALILPAWSARNGFRKAHPFVEDFYTADQKNKARSARTAGIVAGIGLVMVGLAFTMVLYEAQWLAGSIPFLFIAAGVFFIMRGCLLKSRCNLDRYNRRSLSELDDVQIDALDDAGLRTRARRAKRDRGIVVVVMCVATAVALVLLFVPVFDAQRWFWLAWPVGGVLCVAMRAFSSMREDG